jgi:hypothetical protein
MPGRRERHHTEQESGLAGRLGHPQFVHAP